MSVCPSDIKASSLSAYLSLELLLISDSFQCQGGGDGLGVNLRSIVVVAVLMLLMMFAVHCTWVTSNAYSSPSIGEL